MSRRPAEAVAVGPRLPLGRRRRRPRLASARRDLRDRARAARPRRHLRGARRLARPRLDPRRGGARRRRDRRRLAPDEARGAARPGEPIEGEGDRLVSRSRRAARSCSAPPALGDAVRAQVGDRFSLDVTGAYSVIAIVGPEAEHRAAPDDAPPPLPLGRRDRPRAGPRARARRRLLGALRRRSSASTSGRSRSTAPRRSAAGRRRRRAPGRRA